MRLLDAMPCPAWLSAQIDAHCRRRALVLQVWALSDKPTAFLALWIARAASIRGGSVEDALRVFRDALLR